MATDDFALSLRHRYESMRARVDRWLAEKKRTPAWLAKEVGVERSVLSRFLNPNEPNYKPTPNRSRMVELLEKIERICIDQCRTIFLSHRSTDKEFVRRLAADIEADPSGKPLTVWLDEAEIRPGQSIPGAVNGAIQTCRYFGLVLSPDYFDGPSGWTDAEWHSILHGDPDNRQLKILPLLARPCPYVPPLLRHLNMIDLRDRNYDRGLKQLLAVLRDEPLPRPIAIRGQFIRAGGAIDRSTLISERAVPDADPDLANERLYCNLLPIEKLPRYIYRAPVASRLRREKRKGGTTVPGKKELIDYVRQTQEESGKDPRTPAFRVSREDVISFHDLLSPESLLAPIVDQDNVEELDLRAFLTDQDGRNIVIALLNMAIERHASRSGLIHDRTKFQRFFFPPDNGAKRVISWTPFRKRTQRTVTKPELTNGEIVRWMHHACYIRAMFLASRLYIMLVPTRALTSDGRTAIGGVKVGKAVTRILNMERNLHVFYHIRFWTTMLRHEPGPISIKAGDQWLDVASNTAFVEQAYGIAADHKNLEDLLDNEASHIAEQEEQSFTLTDAAEPDDEELLSDGTLEEDEDGHE